MPPEMATSAATLNEYYVTQRVPHDFIYYSISPVTFRRSDYGHSALATM